ncbi:hypothetical protein ACFX2C_014372 [Malus domestica]
MSVLMLAFIGAHMAGFCFADGLASLALLRQDMKDKSSNQAFDWNVTGGSICYLVLRYISWPYAGNLLQPSAEKVKFIS